MKTKLLFLLLSLLLALPAPAQIFISGLSNGASVSDSDLFPDTQGYVNSTSHGTTTKVTAAQLKAYVLSQFTLAAGKTFNFANSLTFAGTDGATLNIGGGGALGSNAFTSTAYVPQSTTVNGHALSGNVVVSASDVTTGTLPIAQVPVGNTGATVAPGSGSTVYVPQSTTVNGHGLSGNVTVSASDVTTGTLPIAQVPVGNTGATVAPGSGSTVYVPQTTTVNGHGLSGNVTVSASDITTGTLPVAQVPVGNTGATVAPGSGSTVYVPQSTTVNGHALTGNVTIAGSDIGGINSTQSTINATSSTSAITLTRTAPNNEVLINVDTTGGTAYTLPVAIATSGAVSGDHFNVKLAFSTNTSSNWLINPSVQFYNASTSGSTLGDAQTTAGIVAYNHTARFYYDGTQWNLDSDGHVTPTGANVYTGSSKNDYLNSQLIMPSSRFSGFPNTVNKTSLLSLNVNSNPVTTYNLTGNGNLHVALLGDSLTGFKAPDWTYLFNSLAGNAGLGVGNMGAYGAFGGSTISLTDYACAINGIDYSIHANGGYFFNDNTQYTVDGDRVLVPILTDPTFGTGYAYLPSSNSRTSMSGGTLAMTNGSATATLSSPVGSSFVNGESIFMMNGSTYGSSTVLPSSGLNLSAGVAVTGTLSGATMTLSSAFTGTTGSYPVIFAQMLPVPAYDRYVFTATPVAGTTITINGQTYTWADPVTAANQVQIASGISATPGSSAYGSSLRSNPVLVNSLVNLRNAINGSSNFTGQTGSPSGYGTGTTANTGVWAACSQNALYIYAKTSGTAGNSIAVSSTGSTGAWDSSTLAGGSTGLITASGATGSTLITYPVTRAAQTVLLVGASNGTSGIAFKTWGPGVDKSIPGCTVSNFSQGGLNLGNFTSCPTSISDPILAGIGVDLYLYCNTDNQGLYQSTMPTFRANLYSGAPYADFCYYSISPDTSDPTYLAENQYMANKALQDGDSFYDDASHFLSYNFMEINNQLYFGGDYDGTHPSEQGRQASLTDFVKQSGLANLFTTAPYSSKRVVRTLDQNLGVAGGGHYEIVNWGPGVSNVATTTYEGVGETVQTVVEDMSTNASTALNITPTQIQLKGAGYAMVVMDEATSHMAFGYGASAPASNGPGYYFSQYMNNYLTSPLMQLNLLSTQVSPHLEFTYSNTYESQVDGYGFFVPPITLGTTSTQLKSNDRQLSNGSSLNVFTLPASGMTVGDQIVIDGAGSGGWKIAQNASQQIVWSGHTASTSGTGGYAASANQYDDITLEFIGSNTYKVVSHEGSPTLN